MEVKNVNYGVSSVYHRGVIEINKKIHGELRKSIILHEKRHNLGKYTKKDYQNDFNSKDSKFFQIFKIALVNPEMLIGYMVLMYSYYLKKWTYNQSAIFPLIYFGLIWVLFFRILFNIGLLLAFFSFLVIYLYINIILLLYTHYYVKTHH
jgi:hypothetical protein